MVLAATAEVDVETLRGESRRRIGTLGGGENAVERRTGLCAQERVVDAEAVVEEGRLALLIGRHLDIARFDEGIEGGRNFEMGEHGRRIAFEAGRQHTRPAQCGTQAADAIVRTEDAQIGGARIGNQRAVGLENEGSAELGERVGTSLHCDAGASRRPARIELRCRFADCRCRGASCGKEAAIGDRVVADTVQERRVRDAVTGRGLGSPNAERRIDDRAGEFGRVELVAAAERAGLRVAAGEEQSVLPGIFAGKRDIAATFGEILACGDAPEIRSAIATRRNAALAAKADAVEIVVQDKVHDARDGIGPINRRIAAGHDIDTFDQVGRNGVHVDPLDPGRSGDLAAAVDQRKRASRTKAAQVQGVDACRADEARRIGLAERCTQLRQLVQRIAQR